MEDKLIEYCKEGNLGGLKKLIKNNPDIDIHANDEYAFRMAAGNGQLKVLKWLIKTFPDICSNIGNIETVFRYSARYGHLGVLKWLIKTFPDIDIYARDEYVFKWAAQNGHLEVLKWLFMLSGNKEEIIELDEVKPYRDDLMNAYINVQKEIS